MAQTIVNLVKKLPLPQQPKQPLQQVTTPRVAVVDNFTLKEVAIDSDNIPDIPHGRVTRRFIEEGLPKAKIDSFEVDLEDGSTYVTALDSVLKNMEKGPRYDALNLSATAEIDFPTLSKVVGTTITPENVARKIPEIKKWLNNEKSDKSVIETRKVIEKLDEISAKGTVLYIGAGNSGVGTFNLYTLAKKAKVVGALIANGKKATFSGDNALVNTSAVGVFEVRKITTPGGKIGFDFTQDGTIDVDANETSAYIKNSSNSLLWGTSISAPLALIRDFAKDPAKDLKAKQK